MRLMDPQPCGLRMPENGSSREKVQIKMQTMRLTRAWGAHKGPRRRIRFRMGIYDDKMTCEEGTVQKNKTTIARFTASGESPKELQTGPAVGPINRTGQASHSTGIRFSVLQKNRRVRPPPTHLVKREHVTRNVALREPRPGVREEVPPLALKRLERGGISEPRVSPRHRLHRHVGLQPVTPFSQRPRVVTSVVLDGLDREPVLGRFGRRVDQSCRAGEGGVGPHVAAHEILWLVGPVAGLWERRGGDDGGSVLVLQSPVDEFEVGFVVLSAHMLRRTNQFIGKRRRKGQGADL